MYWALTAEGEERIETANGDGGGRRVLATAASAPLLAGVSSLVLDVPDNRLYWVNTGSHSMQYLDVATGKITTVSIHTICTQ